jgi:hypothetical protein
MAGHGLVTPVAAMKIRLLVVCLCCLLSTAVPLAWADASTKAAKIAELMQLIGARQFLHEVDGKVDQEEAARAWGRFYSENVTEGDLDAILAYYRSPAGQKDVSASRAALGQVQRYIAQKRAPAPAMSAAAANAAQSAEGAGGSSGTAPARQSGSGVGSAGASATAGATAASGVGPASAGTATAGAVGSAASGAARDRGTASAVGPASPMPPSAVTRAWDSQPRAPDGRIIPSPTLPEQCDTPPPASSSHPVPASGKSIVCVCTDEKGTLTREPVIAESSGDARVDSGALKMARVDSGRYSPPTVAGQPQSACFRFAIDFGHHQ